jgi:microcystin-dependent protein
MSDPFLAEIRIFATDYAPTGWALCNGQLLPISQNTALYSLLGTVYGGDGRSNFALPNLQGRAPMQQGSGRGLMPHTLGESGGTPAVTLQQTDMPAHTHQLMHAGGSADAATPGPATGFARTTAAQVYATGGATMPTVPEALNPGGGGGAHNNLQPYLTLNFCIALQGIFPPRP